MSVGIDDQHEHPTPVPATPKWVSRERTSTVGALPGTPGMVSRSSKYQNVFGNHQGSKDQMDKFGRLRVAKVTRMRSDLDLIDWRVSDPLAWTTESCRGFQSAAVTTGLEYRYW